MIILCDCCRKEIKETEYSFSITKPLKYKSFHTCSLECFKEMLQKNGVSTREKQNPREVQL